MEREGGKQRGRHVRLYGRRSLERHSELMALAVKTEGGDGHGRMGAWDGAGPPNPPLNPQLQIISLHSSYH